MKFHHGHDPPINGFADPKISQPLLKRQCTGSMKAVLRRPRSEKLARLSFLRAAPWRSRCDSLVALRTAATGRYAGIPKVIGGERACASNVRERSQEQVAL